MMQQEFEALAGYKVTAEDYHKIIEPMYMATDLDKHDFVKCIDKKRFAISPLPTKKQVVRDMKKIAAHLFDICGHSSDRESWEQLENMAREYAARFYGLDWTHDSNVFVYFLRGYEYESVQRGCTYPRTLVIGRGYHEYERIALV